MAEVSTGKKKWLTPLITGLLVLAVLFAWKNYPALGTGSSLSVGSSRTDLYFGSSNSIAVLPFELENASQGQEFWPGGFSSELNRLLTLAPGLQVTSRNSTLFFKGQSVPQRAIAERLQVTFLLSGIFRFSGEQVNLSLKLFNARKNEEIWSRRYDISINQLFIIQDEILRDVAKAARLSTIGQLPLAEPVTEEAWVAYLRGLYHQESRTPEGVQLAEEAYRTALELDPGYALARVALASVWLARKTAGDDNPALIENSRAALATVLRSNPGQPEAHGLSSYISRNYDWNWFAALDAANVGLRLNPGDPGLMNTASLAMFSVGQFSGASQLMKTAVQQDPLNLAGRLRLGLLQEFSADYEGALASYRQILGMNPDFPAARAFRARIKIIQKKPESAMKESEQEEDAFWKRYSQILALSAQEQHDEAKIELEKMMAEDGHHAAYQIAEILAFRGELDASFQWLTRAHQQRDGGMKEMIGNYFLSNLHADPRWNEILALMELPLDLDN
jgi:TolB-like protein